MGFFSKDNKKTKKRTTKRKGASKRGGESPWNPENTLFAVKLAGGLVAIGLLCVCWVFAERALVAHVGGTRAVDLKVVYVNHAQWRMPGLAEKFTQLIGSHLSPNPLNQNSLERTRELLSKNAWVKNVDYMTRMPKGEVHVKLQLREPVALVKTAYGYFMIDENACQLPSVYTDKNLFDSDGIKIVDLPVLTGVKMQPPGVGEQWDGGDIRAGIKLGSVVARHDVLSTQVVSVDVTNFNSRVNKFKPQLSLLTKQGSIGWGSAPGEEKGYESKTLAKISNLIEINKRYGSIDAGGQNIYVHVGNARTAEPVR